MTFRQNSSIQSELVIGIIGPVGCNRKSIIDTITTMAQHYSYRAVQIGLSDVIKKHVAVPDFMGDQYVRVTQLMDAGNKLRHETNDNAILAKLAAIQIATIRNQQPLPANNRVIYVIDSIKHPDEVEELRNIYGEGFYLIAVHSSEKSRDTYLRTHCAILEASKRNILINRDKDEKIGYGQSTSEAFHLADFFLLEDGHSNRAWNSLERFLDIIFGNPFKTPTFHEYAMFMAYAASTRSADMSRQVGAVLAKNKDIISTGANECPKPMGGTYWPIFDGNTFLISDVENGRDFMNNVDRNAKEKYEIIEALKKDMPADVLELLEKNIKASGLNDITEYGRVVHAEMDAILSCARRGISCDKAVIFCTTYPCHNCAKHIIASGIKEVVYIEPYPKSKAHDMHSDAIRTPDDATSKDKVLFNPFVGVGPRRFVDLFSMSLSIGEKLKRKRKDSFEKSVWDRSNARPRIKMFPTSYIENEKIVETETTEKLKMLVK